MPLLTPSQVVILDNTSSHHDTDVISMIEATGPRLLFLPPYSPQLNPIEFIWAKVKNFLRKTPMSTTEELYQTIATALDLITTLDAKNSFAHSLK